MANFDTRISAMQTASSNISNLTEQFREQVTQAYQNTQTLRDGWVGDASDQFAENVEILKKWWDELAVTLDTYAAELQKAAEEYQEADNTSAGYFPG